MIKKILLGLLLIILAVAGYVWYKFSTEKGGGFEGEKAKKLEIKSATPLFDNGLAAIMNNYFAVKEAFVNADTAAAKAACSKMITAIDSLKTDEIKKDTSGIFASVEPMIEDVKGNAVRLLSKMTIKEMRIDFDQLNQQLYPLLSSIKNNYKGETVYWQRCPMAFDDTKEAYWLDTKTEDKKRNPYLGVNDPKYKDKMLSCGEQLDSIAPKK